MLTAILLGGRIRHAGSGDPSRYAQADDSSGRVADHMDEALATPAIDPGDLAELAVKNAQLAVDTLSLVPPTGTLRLECEAQEGLP
jgi:hypothetical protein